MRLFSALLRRRMPHGHIYRGKDRLVKPVTLRDVTEMKNKFAIEEENMFYLRHSYLTLEQSKGHAKALGKPEEKYFKTVTARKEFKENVKIEDRLGHLRYAEKWD